MHTKIVETELSDFHKLTPTIYKIHYGKPSPKVVRYRYYKTFSNENFRSDVLREIGRYHEFSFTDFNFIFVAVLNKHAPITKRYIRTTQEKLHG